MEKFSENFSVLIYHWTIPPMPVPTNQVFLVQHVAQLQSEVGEILSVIAMKVSTASNKSLHLAALPTTGFVPSVKPLQ